MKISKVTLGLMVEDFWRCMLNTTRCFIPFRESGLKKERKVNKINLLFYSVKVKTIKLNIKQNWKPEGDFFLGGGVLILYTQLNTLPFNKMQSFCQHGHHTGSSLAMSCNWERKRWGGCAQSFSGPRGNAVASCSLLNQEKHRAYPPMHELIIESSTKFLPVISSYWLGSWISAWPCCLPSILIVKKCGDTAITLFHLK